MKLGVSIDIAAVRPPGGGGSPFGNDFVMTVETTAPSETFTLPCKNVGTYDATIDWGDGTSSSVTAFDDADLVHTYVSAGVHTIRVSGTLPSVFFNNGGDRLKVRTVEQVGDVGWLALDNAWYGCEGMTKFHSGAVCETGLVTSLLRAWTNTTAMSDLNVSTMNTSSVTQMNSIFFGSADLSGAGFNNWDTSSVTNMGDAFRNTTANTIAGVSAWDITALSSSNSLIRFMSGSGASTAEYDALLIAWEAQVGVLAQVSADFGVSQYTSGGAAEAARTSLINDDGWTISDGGPL